VNSTGKSVSHCELARVDLYRMLRNILISCIELHMMSDLLPKSPRPRAIVALISAMLGVWVMPDMFFYPLYQSLLGIIGISISVYLVYTLDQQSEADNADPVDSEEQSSSTPIETLRQRYAAGDISQTEFERQMEQLLETEDLSQTDQPMSLLQNNKDTSHLDSESSSGLTEEEGY
jgi:Predicted membrane protein (DUF2078).